MYSNEALLINQWKGVEFQVKELDTEESCITYHILPLRFALLSL